MLALWSLAGAYAAPPPTITAPTLSERLALVPPLTQDTESQAQLSAPKLALLSTAVVGAAASGTMYVLASDHRQRFNEAVVVSDIERHQRATNGLVVGSMSAGVVALGSGVGFFVVR